MTGTATAPMANTANFVFDSGGAISSAVPTSSMSSRKLEKNSCVHDMTKRRITAEKRKKGAKQSEDRVRQILNGVSRWSCTNSEMRISGSAVIVCAPTAREIAVVPFARAEVVERETEEAEEGVEETARVNKQEHQHLCEGGARRKQTSAATVAVSAPGHMASEHTVALLMVAHAPLARDRSSL